MAAWQLAVAAVVVLFGGFVLRRAHSTRDRYGTVTELADGTQDGSDHDATVRGPVRVAEPGRPERDPPEPLDWDGTPALWAWRVRSKEYTGEHGSSYDWRTVEGGLAVGEFSVRQDWEEVAVDADALATPRESAGDPFDADHLLLGDPEAEAFLGDLDPINRRLHDWGLADEDGAISDLEITVGAVGRTNWPDRYDATVIREGEEVVLRGDLVETDDGPRLAGTDGDPPLVAPTDTLRSQAASLRSLARWQAAFGIGLVVLGVTAVLATLL